MVSMQKATPRFYRDPRVLGRIQKDASEPNYHLQTPYLWTLATESFLPATGVLEQGR